MNERLQVAFDEPTAGWLQLEVHAGESAFRETFSHIYSSLPDLCEALCDVLTGDRQPRRVVFLLEPAEIEMGLAPHADRCRVSLVAFPGPRRDIDGRAVFEFEGATACLHSGVHFGGCRRSFRRTNSRSVGGSRFPDVKCRLSRICSTSTR